MSKYVKAQQLNRRITVQRNTALGTSDSRGFPVEQWVDFKRLWAEVVTVTGIGFLSEEFQAGGEEVSRTRASFRIRHRTDITAGMRILFAGQIYDIRAVLPDTRDNRFVFLGTATGANRG
jgi:SPP1 family predicted phage head-tail adaptor